MNRLFGGLVLGLVLLGGAQAQVIEFESNGRKDQTLTRSGVTVMWAPLPAQLHSYAIVQVAISNGSGGPYVIRPEDFSYVRQDGTTLRASSAKDVVAMLSQKGSGNDVIKLVTAYEASVYGNAHLRSTNGYESRRQAAIAMSSTRFRAAATASALAMAPIKLTPGESTDGAVFFLTDGKPLGAGHMIVRTNTDTFNFQIPSE
jgi:ribosomal protein L24E